MSDSEKDRPSNSVHDAKSAERHAKRMKMERRRGFQGLAILMALALPVFALIITAVLGVVASNGDIQQATDGYITITWSDFSFVAIVYSITLVFLYIFANYCYLFLYDKRSVLLDIVIKLSAATPIALTVLYVTMPFQWVGLSNWLLGNYLTLGIVFSIALIPTAAFLLKDGIELTHEQDQGPLDSLFQLGSTKSEAYWVMISQFERQKYIFAISAFTSFRAIAEFGFLRAVIATGDDVSLSDFVLNFYASLGPRNFLLIGVVIFVGGVFSLFATVLARR